MPEKELIVVGGPNGSGKTTIINLVVTERRIPYVGADKIAAEISPDNPAAASLEAGRMFITEIAERLSQDDSFIVETTLSGKSFRRTMMEARDAGFKVSLLFVYLRFRRLECRARWRTS